ncbi:hypothetical protein ACGFNU_21380 [Spirillospora sp. NPDC048911]|uniref:hypothetical protein n=1 Tax=Spirillospora sp. NPDC048911 TaxID=3364527 RepID=UPI00370F7928
MHNTTTNNARVLAGPWCPYPADLAVDYLGWPVERVRQEFGDTVLIRRTLNGYEFRRPDPAPDSAEVREQVTATIAAARNQPGGLNTAEQIIRTAKFKPYGRRAIAGKR